MSWLLHRVCESCARKFTVEMRPGDKPPAVCTKCVKKKAGS